MHITQAVQVIRELHPKLQQWCRDPITDEELRTLAVAYRVVADQKVNLDAFLLSQLGDIAWQYARLGMLNDAEHAERILDARLYN
jgi:hypothetical protein